MKSNSLQVTKEHYNFSNYVDIKRWISYYYQIKEVIDSGCQSILIIGVGDNVVGTVLSKVAEVIIHTFDFDERLKPTYIGDVRNIEEIVNQKYDCIMCCEVLEHLPFDNFEKILLQFSHIAKKKVIMSLPLHSVAFHLEFKFPKIPYVKLQYRLDKSWIKNWVFNGEHYWEVGIHGKSRKEIKKIYQKYFDIEKDYYVPEHPYHWFCILNAKN